ncbi:interferon alpha/beta receptor 1 isoform X1 [Meriones unguiculatus]|uniref:interferon alpha/beta receptor 1 isoform X1 n=2 Tax=Meriones unguiculatus TaxID=10047 RepID=UPI000B4FB9EF|nr:interferon alpha/beta receptor 1 isoform X1 [Meriones unguiculatus]
MLAVLGAAALVLLAQAPWVLPEAAGGENLRPPENIDVYIVDDNYTLKWNSSEELMGSVTFSAEYQTEELENWLKLPECQHITRTECEFSLLDSDVYVNTKFHVRAEKGNSTSPWSESESFIPFYRAHIGPPGVQLEAEDKAILVNISHPGQGGNMWARESFSFMYKIVIWQTSSDEKKIIETTYYSEKILKLSPETTYCLEVEAVHSLLQKHSRSAVQCINTTVTSKMPTPENVELDARGESYVLKWDYNSSLNVSFRAQWLLGYLKSIPGSFSDQWRPIPTCANVQTTYCVFPQDTFHITTFFLRVQASHGNNTSFWSEEKYINSQKYTTIPPPVIGITPTSDSFRVYVTCQDSSISKCHGLIYEIIFWENTSSTERRMEKENPTFTIVNLQPLTVYCVRARVHSFARWNKSSEFSDKLCKKTKPGNSSLTWIIIGFGAVVFSVMALYAGKCLLKYLSSVFFPSLKPPPSIDEFLSEPPSKTLLLLTAEEHTERCFIVENTDTVAVEESHLTEEDHRKYSSQTSQDSGNYSNEEESSGSESSRGLRP